MKQSSFKRLTILLAWKWDSMASAAFHVWLCFFTWECTWGMPSFVWGRTCAVVSTETWFKADKSQVMKMSSSWLQVKLDPSAPAMSSWLHASFQLLGRLFLQPSRRGALTIKSRALIRLVTGIRELGILKDQIYGRISLIWVTWNGFSRGNKGWL